ncbi:MAG: dual specificity protein phosphatase family protein [Bdellovibrionota bacterium]
MSSPPETPNLRERVEALAVISSCFLIVYNAANRLAAARTSIGVAVWPWESSIPFLPWMIYPYWSLDLFFIGAPFVATTREQLRNFVFQICFATCVAGVCFVAFPLRLLYPPQHVSGMAGFLFNALYEMKDFYNLAPSLHIANLVLVWTLYVPRLRGLPRHALELWFTLIGVSTLFCWRHHVIDLITGFLLALVTLHLFSRRLDISHVSVSLRRNANAKIGMYYLLGSFTFVALSALRPPGTLLLLWPACAVALVGIAYLGFGPQLLGKTDGRFPPWSFILLFPYLVGARISAWLQGRKLPASIDVAPGVRIGRTISNDEAERQLSEGVTAVLDVTAELNEPSAFRTVQYHSLPILDLTAPSPDQLQEAVSFIRSQAEHGTVFVHCALGRSRSAVVVAAYLMATAEEMVPRAALEKLSRVHTHVVMKPEYLAALEAYSALLKRRE